MLLAASVKEETETTVINRMILLLEYKNEFKNASFKLFLTFFKLQIDEVNLKHARLMNQKSGNFQFSLFRFTIVHVKNTLLGQIRVNNVDQHQRYVDPHKSYVLID